MAQALGTSSVQTVRKRLRPSKELASALQHASAEADRFPAETRRMYEIIQQFGAMTESQRAEALKEIEALNRAVSR